MVSLILLLGCVCRFGDCGLGVVWLLDLWGWRLLVYWLVLLACNVGLGVAMRCCFGVWLICGLCGCGGFGFACLVSFVCERWLGWLLLRFGLLFWMFVWLLLLVGDVGCGWVLDAMVCALGGGLVWFDLNLLVLGFGFDWFSFVYVGYLVGIALLWISVVELVLLDCWWFGFIVVGFVSLLASGVCWVVVAGLGCCDLGYWLLFISVVVVMGCCLFIYLSFAEVWFGCFAFLL